LLAATLQLSTTYAPVLQASVLTFATFLLFLRFCKFAVRGAKQEHSLPTKTIAVKQFKK